jgi:hypothetical protein
MPTADIPVHKCNCYEDTTTTSSAARRKMASTEPAPAPRKKRSGSKKAAVVEPPAAPKIYCGESCHNRMLFISCSAETCSVPDAAQCSNRAIKRREAKPVRVEYVSGPGFGLFAEDVIEPGEFVIEYVGEVIDDHECERRLIKYRDEGEEHFYMLEIEKDVVIDARYRSNDARFINHSCDSNSMTQKWNVDGECRIGIFARRRILAGEEITIDYNFSHFGDPMDCKCGSVACTGKLGLKRSDMQTKRALEKLQLSSKKTCEIFDAPPPEIKRPVQLSSLALLKSAKLDMRWLNSYGFKKRRLFKRQETKKPAASQLDATALASLASHPSTTTASSSSSPLSSEWSATTAEDVSVASETKELRKSDWYNHFQRGDHLAEMRSMSSFICGGKFDWTDDLQDVAKTNQPLSKRPVRLVGKRVGLADARARRLDDLLAFAKGASPWNSRVASSARIDPDRIYRFIDAMKNGKVFHNQDQVRPQISSLASTGCLDIDSPHCAPAERPERRRMPSLRPRRRAHLLRRLPGRVPPQVRPSLPYCVTGTPSTDRLGSYVSSCTNLMMLPPQGDPWFCAECKRRAQLESQVTAASTDTHAEQETTSRRNLRGLATQNATTAPVMPSLKRIFHHATTTTSKAGAAAKRRPRKKMKTSDKAYRLLENLPLPAFDSEEEDDE